MNVVRTCLSLTILYVMKLTVNGLGQELFSILVQSVSIKVSEYAY